MAISNLWSDFVRHGREIKALFYWRLVAETSHHLTVAGGCQTPLSSNSSPTRWCFPGKVVWQEISYDESTSAIKRPRSCKKEAWEGWA